MAFHITAYSDSENCSAAMTQMNQYSLESVMATAWEQEDTAISLAEEGNLSSSWDLFGCKCFKLWHKSVSTETVMFSPNVCNLSDAFCVVTHAGLKSPTIFPYIWVRLQRTPL